jgi:hypothetical protein
VVVYNIDFRSLLFPKCESLQIEQVSHVYNPHILRF